MRHFALLIGLLLLASGCLHPGDGEANQTPKAKADTEGGGRTFAPDAEIWFTGAGSRDPDGAYLEYFWDFDRNDQHDEMIIGDINNNGRASHAYPDEGGYTATLTVRDVDGAEDTATVTVTIKDESTSLRAIITTNDENEATYRPGQPVEVDFSAADSTAKGDITSYEWDFSYDDDDGFQTERSSDSPETEQDFESGVFVISVRITDTLGEQDEAHGSDDLEPFINFNATITETIFGWPGLGKLLIDSINNRDLPVITAVVFVVALMVMAINLIVDLIYTWLDPRISYK
nr:PKD domain-containing protein [uncultured Halomonas sp.]